MNSVRHVGWDGELESQDLEMRRRRFMIMVQENSWIWEIGVFFFEDNFEKVNAISYVL